MAFVQRGSAVTAVDSGLSDEFGYGLAVDSTGTILAVGARGWDGAYTNQGGVYVYDWSGSAWVQRGGIINAPDAAENYRLGISCALNADGTILALGGTLTDGSSGTGHDVVYLYDWSGSAWVARATPLQSSDYVANDAFGCSLALSADGNILVVGARARNSNRGGVYIYDWSGSAWVQRGAMLLSADIADYDNFGSGVALSDDGLVLAVGALYWEGSFTNQGGVYIYDWSGSAWVQRGGVLTPSSPAAGYYFGSSVALASSGDLLIVGSKKAQVSGITTGMVYAFSWSGSAWVQQQILNASDYASVDDFGAAVAINNDAGVLAVGAPFWDGTHINQGAVYLFDGPITPKARLSAASPLGAPMIRITVGIAVPAARISLSSALGAPRLLSSARVFGVPHLDRLTAYISGSEDGLDDYPITLVSFNMSKRSGAQSYYSLSCQYSDELLSALTDRPNGIVYIRRDGVFWESFHIGHPVRYDIGPRSISLSINGTRQSTNAMPSTISVEPRMVISVGVNATGSRTFNMVPGMISPRAGDRIIWDARTWLIDLVKYQANSDGQMLSLSASEIV